MESLLKIPAILAITILIRMTNSPPRAAATTKTVKQVPGTTPGGKYFDRIGNTDLPIMRVIIVVIAIAEIAIIALPSILPGLGLAIPQVLQINLHDTALSIIGLVLIALGGSFKLLCYYTLKRFHTYGLYIVEDHKLVTVGPYGIVRHPSYTASMILWTGMVFWYLAPGSILAEAGGSFSAKVLPIIGLLYVASICNGILGRIVEEDEMLKSMFGAEWVKWVKSVPYALVPGLY